MIYTSVVAMVLIIALSVSCPAQSLGGGEANPTLKTNPLSLKQWQEMRFGMFIHWGPVSLCGTEIGWSRGLQVPIQEYDNLYKEFNPVLFNAKEWVGLAKKAGMKYIVITSKHHDGFCLWDSKYTEYDIMATPFHRDVLKELSEECERQGILFCTYYSILDWHHPDYTTRYGGDTRPVEQSNMNTYKTYLKNQIQELVKKYKIKMLWFDGEWEKSWTHADGMDLYAYARELNDALLINNRVDKGRAGRKGMTTSDKYAGDFGTPEQEIGLFNNFQPWESCITICNQWAWKPNDKLKSLQTCLQMLVQTAGGGGNLLLNVGPMLDGRIEERQQQRLLEVGTWLKNFGESIYGTRGGPYKPVSWLASTHKENRIYLHLFLWPKDGLHVPALAGRKVLRASLLGGKSLNVSSNNTSLTIELPAKPTDENDTVVVLELDGAAEAITPLDVPEMRLVDRSSDAIRLTNQASPTYAAQGVHSLVDNVHASSDYKDGKWLGFEENDFEAVFDLGMTKTLKKVVVGCLQTQESWIFFPKSIEISTSEEGTTYKVAKLVAIGEPSNDDEVKKKDFELALQNVQTRYVKVKAVNVGACPSWHYAAGGKCWVFVDEVVIE
ncbi:MAG: alpha-L-fucosidase [bacterium]